MIVSIHILSRGWFFDVPAALWSDNVISGHIVCGGPRGSLL
jgi:hypothetical protein